MTRVNTEQLKYTPWFAKAGAACSIVPIARFINDRIFTLKGGGYGCLFSLAGIDEEGLTDQELEAKLRSIEGALRGLPEGACLYQYTRVMSGFDLPKKATYPNPVTQAFVADRLAFLDKSAGFRRIDLHWCLTLEPPKVAAFTRKPKENNTDTTRMLADLEKTATLLEGHLGGALGLKLLDKNAVFQFISYLFNLEEWATRYTLTVDDGVDRQVVQNPVAWYSDHLTIGRRYVQMFSLKTAPEASRPCLFSGLMALDCDSVLLTTWRPKSTTAARSEIDAQEKFISFFKVGVLTRVMSGHDTASFETGAGARAANTQVDDLGEVIRSLDKKAQGEFSLRFLVATRSLDELRGIAPAVHRVFVDARAQVMEETLGNLSAFYAMFPGNHKFNVFSMWLAEDHHARLASIFAPNLGHPYSEDLDNEYLNVFETRTRTPFFQDVYVDGVRVMLILGPTGSGKTTVVQSIREGAEKSSYMVKGFAPTSRAATQLREAGIDASTLQSFLARGENHPGASSEPRHLYMLDESSLASTRQMRAFLEKLKPQDRVLVIGDTNQHQAVDAGRPFEQMQEAGMRTSHLDQIMRQKDPELRRAVELLAENETEKGVALLAEQGRVTEVVGANERIAAIARDYAVQSENTIIISPDNRSRRQINEAVRSELRRNRTLAADGHELRVLDHRSDMTGADRTWAARYNMGDVLHYRTGSKVEGIERNSFARVREVDARDNTITVELDNGASVSYDPRRLRGVNVFTEAVREFSTGDRIQFTEPNKTLGIANRDLGTITVIDNGQMTVRLDGKQTREITFNTDKFRQFDHGYAVTSHSSQGLTAGRVIANIDTESSRMLINTRLAYVAVSRASEDVRIYTNDAETLGQRLAADISKTSAVDFRAASTTEQVREVVQLFRDHQPDSATEQLQQQGRVHEYQSPDHRLAAVALEYEAHPDRIVVVAPDAAERRELTQLICADLRRNGRLAWNEHSVAVLVEQKFSNLYFTGNYLPGDAIHFRVGSPTLEGIPHNSMVRVLEVDAGRNALTIETADGGQVTYNPAKLRVQTNQSKVYRKDSREMAVGECIRFTASEKENHIRTGDFATVEQIVPDLTVRLDNGKTVKLDAEAARHIDYGYAVESAANLTADRVILTGEASQLAGLGDDLARLNSSIRELSVYTSDATQTLQVGLAHHPASAEALSKPLVDVANLSVAEPSIAEAIIEEIGLHL